MNEEKNPEVKMVIPCKCPECDKDIVIKLDIPAPNITDVLKAEDIDEDIKKLINENRNDTSEENTTK